MTTAPVFRAILVEQTERTRRSSKADIARFIEESEHRIASLESQIRILVELRERERVCVDALRYIISPIRTLPIELLVEIFELAINDETHVEDVYRISQICADWRKVAHATPRLWTRPICVDLAYRSGSRGQLYADGLEACDPRIPEHIFRISPRFHSLYCPDSLPLSIMSRLAECRLDSLEELQLGLVGHSDHNTPPIPPL
ncbi:hypothetical protein C8R45DRAFT_483340 [Mycena sanguinolenta]|nr:hypothetical protein C8R45DRAFT_483340 [Mycena sanguinolenta]